MIAVACSENSAKLTPDLALSDIFDGPRGSGVPTQSSKEAVSLSEHAHAQWKMQVYLQIYCVLV